MTHPIVFEEIMITGSLTIKDTGLSSQTRSSILVQDVNIPFPVRFDSLRIWDAYQIALSGTANTDDLALVGGAFGTVPPVISAGDLKAAGATSRHARFQVNIPECYDTGQTLILSLSAGMKTTVADTSCTIDVEAFKIDKISGIGADICATAAMTMNSLVFAAKAFTITPSGLVAGDVLDVRIKILCTDAATGTDVTPTIASIDLLADIRG